MRNAFPREQGCKSGWILLPSWRKEEKLWSSVSLAGWPLARSERTMLVVYQPWHTNQGQNHQNAFRNCNIHFGGSIDYPNITFFFLFSSHRSYCSSEGLDGFSCYFPLICYGKLSPTSLSLERERFLTHEFPHSHQEPPYRGTKGANRSHRLLYECPNSEEPVHRCAEMAALGQALAG